MSNLNNSTQLKMESYITGDTVHRPWGHYEVINVGIDNDGKEYCEKLITVNPGQILSLQSHKMRQEIWTVKQGKLEVILNGAHYRLSKGNGVKVPVEVIHCMANNINNEPCIVHERQEGVCREDDIIRYIDSYGRQTQELNYKIQANIDLYNRLRKEINE